MMRPARIALAPLATTALLALGSGAHAATVPARPTGPSPPSGNWTLEYADAFSAPFGTAPGDDNTLYPNRYDDCNLDQGYNSDEMEVFSCTQATIGKNGLSLTCAYTPNVAANYGIEQNYTCGAAQGDDPSSAPAGYDFFGWKPGLGQEWALQARMRLPYNTGEADPGWWSDGPPWNQEIDMLEGFGWEAGTNGTWCDPGTANTNGYVGTVVPTWIYDKSPNEAVGASTDICRDEGFDPSAAMHTYTTVFYPDNTAAEYIDGKAVSWTWVPNGGADCSNTSGTGCSVIGPASPGSGEWGGLILSYALREEADGDPDPYFTTGARSFKVRYIAVYENATANGANTFNAGLAPGTTVR